MEMKSSYSLAILVVLYFYFSLNTNVSLGIGDTISGNESLTKGETIISSSGVFEFGFFRPDEVSRNDYIGIWYKNLYPQNTQTVVWVANREKPVEKGVLTITQGNLVLLDEFGNSTWSALDKNVTGNISVTAVLLDDGNLVLRDMSDPSAPLWQSFDYPSHTFLPGAKLGYDKRTQRKQVLTSWKNINDPAPGLFSLELDPLNAQYVLKWNRSIEYWTSGSWDGQGFSGVPEMRLNDIYNYSYTDNEKESYFMYSLNNSSITSRLIMDVSGQIKNSAWLTSFDEWMLFWSQPRQQCEVYGSYCNINKVSMKLKAILSSVSTFMLLLICSFSCIYYRRKRMRKGEERRKSTQETQISHRHKDEGEVNLLMTENNGEVIDVPYFHLETILAATDNFSVANKLGQGGFGPVYKGIFPGGKEIAVKRLSSHSGQGIDEFKNEVTLIAKLQHRNLVRLFGYCINATEQILLYEYMPNKSLDIFIFDGTLCQLLDWKKRYDIIMGIARGLAYLHHESRLRIIHRDLKTSNILLDEEMNPKISDFGLARIVEGKKTEANTKKIVGSYGYMSPEYALDGLFSIKSDVFSFGVVVLEIISGRRNTGFYKSEEALNLLGYAWRLWIEENVQHLIEKSLLESCNTKEVIKCINIALLCVQEDQNDRPNMLDVIAMLVGDGMRLTRPNQPAFVTKKQTFRTSSSPSGKHYIVSNNQVTITMEEGR